MDELDVWYAKVAAQQEVLRAIASTGKRVTEQLLKKAASHIRMSAFSQLTLLCYKEVSKNRQLKLEREILGTLSACGTESGGIPAVYHKDRGPNGHQMVKVAMAEVARLTQPIRERTRSVSKHAPPDHAPAGILIGVPCKPRTSKRQSDMEVSESCYLGVPVVEVRGEVDHATCNDLEETCIRALGKGNKVALDLGDCPYMDSGGISVLLSLLKRVRPEGAVAVISPDPNLLRILEMVGLTLDQSFRVLSSKDELAELAG
jgi:anti-anti-sigma factor